MELILKNHDYKYAVEQIMLMLFPGERPVYPEGGKPAGDQDGRSSVSRIATVVAAVLLIAVIGVGVVMALRLGILNRGTSQDPKAMAQEAYDNKDYDKTIAQLEQLLREGGGDADAYDLLARAYEAGGNPEGAAETFSVSGRMSTKAATSSKRPARMPSTRRMSAGTERRRPSVSPSTASRHRASRAR